MKRLIFWIADRRRPDVIEDHALTWRLLRIAGRTITLTMLYRSDDVDDYRPSETPLTILVLRGVMIVRRKIAGGFYIDDMLTPGSVRRYGRNAMINMTMSPTTNFEDGMITLGWMQPPDRIFNADFPIWLLAVQR